MQIILGGLLESLEQYLVELGLDLAIPTLGSTDDPPAAEQTSDHHQQIQ